MTVSLTTTPTVPLATGPVQRYRKWMHRHGRHHHACVGVARGAFALPDTAPRYERSLPFRFLHLDVDLRVLVAERKVRGRVTHTIERVAKDAAELCLDAVDFDIRGVEVNAGKGFVKAPFDYDDRTLRVRLGARFQSGRVRIQYEAAPRRGLYFLRPDEKVPERPLQVWSQCQDEDARHWLPCHDKPHVKVPASFKYTVPGGMRVLANGEQVAESKRESRAGTRRREPDWSSFRYHIDEPISSYLITLVVGHFDVVRDRDAVLPSGRKVPVEYWLPLGRRAEGLRALNGTPKKLELFSRLLGADYPFSRYTQVVVSDFIFGGMENTTASTLYEHVLLDERAALDVESHDLVAHELAHQWFGDWLTCRDWPEAWLNEGFATYFEHVDREHRKGKDEYLHGVERDLESYLAEARGRYQRPVVCRDYQDPIDLFDRHLYEKGSLILHLLRRTLGDDTFWAGLSRYVNVHARGLVATGDLQSALETAAGRSLDRFFDEWLRRPGHPQLTVKVTWQDKRLTVQYEQTQKAGPYALDLELEVLANGRRERHLIHTTERHGAHTQLLPTRPSYVAIDPELRIAGELNVVAPSVMLRSQLLEGSNARVRRAAARSLGKHHDFKTAAALQKVLNDEKSPWMVRAACAEACGKLLNEAALATLLGAVGARSPEVRAAVAEALGAYREARAATALTTLLDDQSYLVSATATHALAKTRTADAARHLEHQLEQTSWADVVASAALDGFATLRERSHAPLLKRRTEYGFPTRVRRSAVVALAKLAKSEDTRLHLGELLDDPHPHFRLSVVSALEELGDRKVRGLLHQRLARESDGRVVRRIREALRRLDGAQPTKEVADKVGQLERELSELKARLATLEATKKKGH